MAANLPRVWSRAELQAHREQAVALFVSWFRAKGTSAYAAHYARALLSVRELFRLTDDLLNLGPHVVAQEHKALRTPARYVAGPPLSDDELRTLAGIDKLWDPKQLKAFTDV